MDRRIYILLRDNLYKSAEGEQSCSEVELMTEEQAKAANSLQPKEGPWRWHLMDTRAFEMINRPTEEVVVMKEPAATVAASGDARSTAWADVLAGKVIKCKAFDFEERKWYNCELALNDAGAVCAEDSEGFEWKVEPNDLLDPKQFKF